MAKHPRMTRFRALLVTVFNPLTLLIVIAMATPEVYGRLGSQLSATPSPEASPVRLEATPAISSYNFFEGATKTQGDEVERFVWGADASEITGVGLTPISFTIGNYDNGVYLFAEFKNTSPNVLLVPILRFEALYEGKGFGEESAHSPQYYARPGESVYYEGYSLYRGAVLYGDWTDMRVTFMEGYDYGDEYSALDLRLDRAEGKVYNDGTMDVGSIVGLNINGIGRDSEGVFVATCYAGRIDATIPAGLFVRIPNDIRPGPGRYCRDEGRSFVDRLGTGPMSVEEWIITVPKP